MNIRRLRRHMSMATVHRHALCIYSSSSVGLIDPGQRTGRNQERTGHVAFSNVEHSTIAHKSQYYSVVELLWIVASATVPVTLCCSQSTEEVIALVFFCQKFTRTRPRYRSPWRVWKAVGGLVRSGINASGSPTCTRAPDRRFQPIISRFASSDRAQRRPPIHCRVEGGWILPVSVRAKGCVLKRDAKIRSQPFYASPLIGLIYGVGVTPL